MKVFVYISLFGAFLLPARAPAESAVGSDDERVREAVEALLVRTFPTEAPRLQVDVQRVELRDDVVDAHSDQALTASFAVNPAALPRGLVKVNLVSSTATQPVDVGWALVSVSPVETLAILTRDKLRGDRITADDVGTIASETSLRSNIFFSYDALNRLLEGGAIEATRNISAGQPIRLTDVHAAAAVETGTNLSLRLRRGSLMLTLPVVSRQAGAVGAIIRLYSSDLKTTYRGRIVDARNADWVETL